MSPPGSPGSRGPSDASEPSAAKDEEEIPEGLKTFLGGSTRQAGINADLAYGLFGGILALGFIGWLIDRWRGTYPAGMLIGMALGGVVGFYRLGRAMLGKR